jgi:hypothetical protein
MARSRLEVLEILRPSLRGWPDAPSSLAVSWSRSQGQPRVRRRCQRMAHGLSGAVW